MIATFRKTAGQHGIPASTLTDNGMVYTVRLAGIGRRGGRNGFEATTPRLAHHPEELPTQPPHHLRESRTVPTDPEEVAPRPSRQPATIAELQALLDQFVDEYNHHRPTPLPATPRHPGRPLRHHCPRPCPGNQPDADTHDRVRHDRIDKTGTVTLRINGKLHHIGVGRTHARTHVILLIQDLDVRIINAVTGELLRELTIDPNRDYQPRNNERPEPTSVGPGLSDVLRHHMVGLTGFEPAASSSRTTRATKLRHSPMAWASLPEGSGCDRDPARGPQASSGAA